MRRRKSVEPRFFVGIAAVAVLCILSAVYSGVTGNPSPVSRAAGAVIRPVQRLASGIGGVFGRGIGYFTEFDELKAENEELKKQLRENEQLVRDAQLAIEENNRFRAQAGQPERQRNLTTVNAEVISRNPGDTAVTLTLDKGTAHGVAKGDLVTTIDGMVGYVSEAGSNTCEVTTVTDVDMQCGALITRTRETAIAEGRCAVLQGSVADMIFADDWFDAVTAFETVYFWPDLLQCFREVCRVLKGGGTFLICNESNGDTDKDEKWTEIIGGMTIYSGDELKTFLENAGFCNVQIHKNKMGWLCVTGQKREE